MERAVGIRHQAMFGPSHRKSRPHAFTDMILFVGHSQLRKSVCQQETSGIVVWSVGGGEGRLHISAVLAAPSPSGGSVRNCEQGWASAAEGKHLARVSATVPSGWLGILASSRTSAPRILSVASG